MPEKPRVQLGTIRPASRNTYDQRVATALPSATGGAPPQRSGDQLAAATGTEGPGVTPGTAQTPDVAAAGSTARTAEVSQIERWMSQGNIRMSGTGTLTNLAVLNRPLSEYTQNNQEEVAVTKQYLDQLVAGGADVTQGAFADTDEMARWVVAHVARSFEPGAIPKIPDYVHQTSLGRRVVAWQSYMKGARNAGA